MTTATPIGAESTDGGQALALPTDQAAFVQRLRAGDAAAFEQLVRVAGPRMLAVARRMLPAEDDAHDAVQDAMVSALRSLDRFDGRSLLTTWLHRITVNTCLMKLRSRRRRPERSIEEFLPTYLPDGHRAPPVRAWNDAGPAALEREELRRLVRTCIDELPSNYREVLMLRDIEGLDTQEAAAMLGVTPNAVKTRLHRARQALQELLDPHLRDRD
jgi:RNA polymerase sigma-70 factor, ECF subfamily